MATVYNSQLDAFELYHASISPNRPSSDTTTSLLPALGHGLAGAAGATISNLAVYPLDLIITRLQLQKHLRKEGPKSRDNEEDYKSLEDAVKKIYEKEGLKGFYSGVLEDTVKTLADSFLFFVAYAYLRRKRLEARSSAGNGKVSGLSALEELGVGFVAGSGAKLCTTPIANVVTRLQAAALTDGGSQSENENGSAPRTTSSKIAKEILEEKGPMGFWSGYSASLVLTLNPSLTFFLFETFKRLLLPRSRRDSPPAAVTFLLSAVSKACASSVTYPFSLAKARAQAGSKKEEKDEHEVVEKDTSGRQTQSKAARSTIFSTLLTIAQTEGPGALYEGLHLEIVKGFFSHGITMLAKQAIHRFVVRLYYVLAVLVSRYKGKTNPVSLAERAKNRSVEYYDLAIARAGDRVEEGKKMVMGRATDMADFVGEYIPEEGEEWKDLYGTIGLSKWLESRSKGE